MTEDEYVTERFRSWRPYQRGNPWTTPDQFSRALNLVGMEGGQRDFSLNKRPPADPILGSSSTGGAGSGSVIPDIIIVFNGTAKYCDLNGVIKGNV